MTGIELTSIAPFLIGLIALYLIALIDIFRTEQTRGPKWMWMLLIVLIPAFGAIVYFVAGKVVPRRP
ncbi:PLD nuclease N-terminal domain-containing protein [Marinicrinis sediminis]|uniref:PLD nuclease N-terminal domain-containing protein n=1 Tax=Marinicrinis sediminis TaxID=1652465 RepID=A0ABW5REQ8_9BACL